MKPISKIIQAILLIIGLPFFIIDRICKNKVSEKVINKIASWFDIVNWWGNK